MSENKSIHHLHGPDSNFVTKNQVTGSGHDDDANLSIYDKLLKRIKESNPATSPTRIISDDEKKFYGPALERKSVKKNGEGKSVSDTDDSQ